MKQTATRALPALVLACLCLWAWCPASGMAAENRTSGTASWFGQWHHGKHTASGEPFDMYAMTAAHRTLPFGTVLRVTNTGNGREVVVRVNDRGPYSGNRILDLSYAAADRLGMRVSGTARITMEVVGDTSGNPLNAEDAFFVNLEGPGQTSPERESASLHARQYMERLMRVGFHEAPGLLHTARGMVVLGPFSTIHTAQEILNRVSTAFPSASLTLLPRAEASPVSGG